MWKVGIWIGSKKRVRAQKVMLFGPGWEKSSTINDWLCKPMMWKLQTYRRTLFFFPSRQLAGSLQQWRNWQWAQYHIGLNCTSHRVQRFCRLEFLSARVSYWCGSFQFAGVDSIWHWHSSDWIWKKLACKCLYYECPTVRLRIWSLKLRWNQSQADHKDIIQRDTIQM